MESTASLNQDFINQCYNEAASLLVNQSLSVEETKNALVAKGLDPDTASTVVESLAQQIHDAKKERAKKDMLYGALWCVGGIIATVADIGFIFWVAILFGGIQFFRGLANA